MAFEGPLSNEVMQKRRDELAKKQQALKEALKPKPVESTADEKALAAAREEHVPAHARELNGGQLNAESVKNLISNTLRNTRKPIATAQDVLEKRLESQLNEHGQLAMSLESLNKEVADLEKIKNHLTEEDVSMRAETDAMIEGLQNTKRVAVERMEKIMENEPFMFQLQKLAEEDNERFDKVCAIKNAQAEGTRIENGLFENTRKMRDGLLKKKDGTYEHFEPEIKAEKFFNWITPDLLRLKYLSYELRDAGDQLDIPGFRDLSSTVRQYETYVHDKKSEILDTSYRSFNGEELEQRKRAAAFLDLVKEKVHKFARGEE